MNAAKEGRPVLRVGLVLGHLALVCALLWGGLGATSDDPVARTLRTYRSVAGLFRDYSFFAPNVSSGTRVGFMLETRQGSRFEPLTHRNPEVARRLQCIASTALNERKARELLGRSLAATALGKHPDATAVTVVGQKHELPSPEAYRAGARPTWQTLYAQDFARKAP